MIDVFCYKCCVRMFYRILYDAYFCPICGKVVSLEVEYEEAEDNEEGDGNEEV